MEPYRALTKGDQTIDNIGESHLAFAAKIADANRRALLAGMVTGAFAVGCFVLGMSGLATLLGLFSILLGCVLLPYRWSNARKLPSSPKDHVKDLVQHKSPNPLGLGE